MKQNYSDKIKYYNLIEKYCLLQFTNIAVIGSLKHPLLIDSLKKHKLNVTEIDHDYFTEKINVLKFNVVFEEYNWKLHDLIIVMCGEHIYPLPKMVSGHYVYIIKKHPHIVQRACTNTFSDLGLIEHQVIECEKIKMIIGESNAT